MSDTPDLPPIPKKLSKFKRQQAKKVTPEDMEKLLLTADQMAAVFLSKEYCKEHAAATLGWTVEMVEETLNLPAAKCMLQDAYNEFIEDYSRERLRNFRKVGVTAANVEARLMDIAQMDPRHTKGNVDGQVKALRTLAETLGMFNQDDPLKNKSRKELEGFVQRAARMLPPEVPDKTTPVQ